MKETGKKLTESHELRSDSDREDEELKDLDHLEIRICSLRDEDRSDEEKESFCKIDKAVRNTKGTTFNEGTANTSNISVRNSVIKLLFEYAFEGHASNCANV